MSEKCMTKHFLYSKFASKKVNFQIMNIHKTQYFGVHIILYTWLKIALKETDVLRKTFSLNISDKYMFSSSISLISENKNFRILTIYSSTLKLLNNTCCCNILSLLINFDTVID